MVVHDDFLDAMSQETLTDMADHFFGTRKELENKIRLFYSYVKALRQKQVHTDRKTAFLNALFLNPALASGFYESVGVSFSPFSQKGEISDDLLPEVFPSALTTKGKFVRLAVWAYERLQKACDEYHNGSQEGYKPGKDDHLSRVHYRLVDSMCYVINQEIAQVNEQNAPSQILHCFKSFSVRTEDRECIMGGGSFHGDECSLNQELAFRPVDFESLKLKKYPELPPQNRANTKITQMCKKIYAHHKDTVRAMVSDLKKRCDARRT